MKKRYESIDLIRIAMAIIIIIYHINLYCYNWELPLLFPSGYRCVDVFFVFAGFFLVNSLRKRENFGIFLRDKLLRLYPAYIICYLCNLVLAILTNQVPTCNLPGVFKYSNIGIDFLMMQNWGWNMPSLGDWYISALLLCFILTYFLHRIIPNNLTRRIVFLAIAILGATIIFVFHTNLHVHEARHHISSGVIRGMIGICIGVWTKENEDKLRLKTPSLCFLVSGIFLLLMMFLFSQTTVDFLIYPIAVMVLLSGLQMNKKEEKPRFANVLVFLGNISFEVYLIHSFVRNVLLIVENRLIETKSVIPENVVIIRCFWLFLAANIIISILFAIIINQLARVIVRFIGKRKANDKTAYSA